MLLELLEWKQGQKQQEVGESDKRNQSVVAKEHAGTMEEYWSCWMGNKPEVQTK